LDDRAHLVGDATRAHAKLGWEPSIGFEELVQLMVDADLARLDPERTHEPQLDWPAAAAW
jgi:GDP-D-mannose dehydratase